MRCPECEGGGPFIALVKPRRGPCRTEFVECQACKGTGEIDEEQARRIEEGRRLMKERIARGESLREAAVRLGVSVVKLSQLEHGRAD